MDKKFQEELVVETAKRLAADNNRAAAFCLLSIAASMAMNYETVLADKL